MADRFVRSLRANRTAAEELLWAQLRKKRIAGVRFRRQFRIGKFVVDFVCLSARLIIEVDGTSHELTFDADDLRTNWLQSQRFRVIRFTNDDVRSNLDGVVATIERGLSCPQPLPLSPSREGRGE